ncbi:DUF4381 domain-containing protein [Thalassotalea sp. HSM 43]|uniref:DUF4381 domain-containing protein n=1 Tax=Thalassotalea sp. HSM 43 TaxID=2552945 RepID=UPI0010814EAF|nr:DUF4381 domain-containing protein [Thalassotalea sp. HSM 43]QBY03338.1 DUF4381 domain-containing protein [Thalassotalea sp. HSM 43]
MDPLENLKDIHLPDSIHAYPIAPGWWILLALVLAIVVYLLIKNKRKQRFLRQQKTALVQLQQLEAPTVEQCVAILKWVAMHYFQRHLFANNFSVELLQALKVKLPEQHQAKFIELAESALAQQYRKNANTIYGEDMQRAAIYWLTHIDLVSKNNTSIGANTSATEPQEKAA